MLNPNETIWFVPLDTPGFDPDAPSAAALTEARNLSCAIVTGYTLNPTDSDTDDSTTICDNANVDNPTSYNYEANITFEREALGAGFDATSPRARAFEFFKQPDAEGFLVRRLGMRNTVPAAAGQVVSVFKVTSDFPQDVVPDDNGAIQMTVPFLQQGKLALDVALVA